MKRLVLEPNGWPCTILECPPGHFIHYSGKDRDIGFKTEYGKENERDNVFNSAGEYFRPTDGDKCIVQPVYAEWKDDE